MACDLNSAVVGSVFRGADRILKDYILGKKVNYVCLHFFARVCVCKKESADVCVCVCKRETTDTACVHVCKKQSIKQDIMYGMKKEFKKTWARVRLLVNRFFFTDMYSRENRASVCTHTLFRALLCSFSLARART